MKRTILTMIAISAMAAGANAAVLVAGWDFQTTTGGGTAAVGKPNSPTSYLANAGSQIGTADLLLNGSNGSSTWLAASQLDAFGGTALNAGTGMSTSTASPSALALVNTTSNGQSAVFKFSMTNLEDLAISYAAQRTSTGFTSEVWSWSTDGVNFTTFDTESSIASAFAVISIASISNLDNAANAYIKLTVNGASSASGNNRLDNIQFNATSVPEPTTTAMLLGGAGMMLWMIRRKRAINS